MSLTSQRAEQLLRDTLVNRRVRIELGEHERRAFVGTFICVDHAGNVVLNDVTEVRLSNTFPHNEVSKRPVPITMIPGTLIAAVHSADAPDMQVTENSII